MSIPQSYPCEMRRYNDELTGRPVIQLTGDPASQSHHLYFTENSFTRGKHEIYFLSDRDTPGVLNVLRMDLVTGRMARVTGYTAPCRLSAVTKDPDSTHLLYWRDGAVTLMALDTGETRVLFTLPEGFRPGRLSLSCDLATVAVQVNEDVHVEHGVNYAGFAEKMYRVKRSIIYTVPADGSAPARAVVRDTAEGGHLQFSPVNPHLIMFCHEGPWHIVQQRIFLCDIRTGALWPCCRQGPDDCVGHEFFTRDGRILFDNRGPGHDGTITSARTQAVIQPPQAGGFAPYVGLAGEDGNVLATYAMPHSCNHYHANTPATLLVGDEVDDLVLIDLSAPTPTLRKLCHHGTSWHGQQTHCHPTFAWDDSAILFASDRTGTTQVYLVAL